MIHQLQLFYAWRWYGIDWDGYRAHDGAML